MASPLAHSVAGCGLALLLLPRDLWLRILPGARPATPAAAPSERAILIGLLGAVVLANAPDLDFVPVIFFGYAQALVHRTATHSLLATVLVGIAFAAFFRRTLAVPWRTAIVMATTSYGSHLLLDLSVPDPLPPEGIQLLWPISRLYVPPVPILPMFDLGRLAAGELWPAVRTLTFELLGVGGAVGVMLFIRSLMTRRPSEVRTPSEGAAAVDTAGAES